jgi:spore germination protein YaaH
MQDHEVWLEESTSAAARLPLADRYQTGGVATWRLGHEDPTVWTVVERWRRGEP